MTIQKLAVAMQIFARYAAADDYTIAAEHDEIWVGSETWPLTDEDRAIVEECGFSTKDGMGWHAFV